MFHKSINFCSSFLAYLNWVWEILNHLAFFYHQPTFQVPKNSRLEAGGGQFGDVRSSTELVECAVCLSTIKEDDEIRVLRCKHLFHRKCLDRCVEHQHTTCPLCRDYLEGPRMICELGRELIVFSFYGNDRLNDEDYGNWWLR